MESTMSNMNMSDSTYIKQEVHSPEEIAQEDEEHINVILQNEVSL